MKLHKVLTIGGVVYPLITDDVRLELRTPGRATLTIEATAPVKGLVTLAIRKREVGSTGWRVAVSASPKPRA